MFYVIIGATSVHDGIVQGGDRAVTCLRPWDAKKQATKRGGLAVDRDGVVLS